MSVKSSGKSDPPKRGAPVDRRRAVWPVLKEVVVRWNENDGNSLAASMAYYAAFSFFPLLLLVISALGFTLRFASSTESAQEALLAYIGRQWSSQFKDEVASILTPILEHVQNNAAVTGPVGLLILLFGAIGIFTQMNVAFDRIWHDSAPSSGGLMKAIRNALGTRLKAFLILIGLSLLISLSFFGGLVLTGVKTRAGNLPMVNAGWKYLELLISISLNALVFMLLYKLMPKALVRWKDALYGGVMVAIVWEAGKQVLGLFIIGSHYTAYGVVGSFIAMMLWVYYASCLLFLGAQWVQVLGHPPASPPKPPGEP